MWLVFEDSGMSKGEHELEHAEKDNEPGDQHPEIFDRCRDHQREYLLEDEFDEEFWLKVKQVSKFIWKSFGKCFAIHLVRY